MWLWEKRRDSVFVKRMKVKMKKLALLSSFLSRLSMMLEEIVFSSIINSQRWIGLRSEVQGKRTDRAPYRIRNWTTRVWSTKNSKNRRIAHVNRVHSWTYTSIQTTLTNKHDSHQTNQFFYSLHARGKDNKNSPWATF